MTPAGGGTESIEDAEHGPEPVTTFFRVKSQAEDGETRDVTVQAATEDEARSIVEGQERDLVAYRLLPEALADKKNPPSAAHLHAHEQLAPYEITDITPEA